MRIEVYYPPYLTQGRRQPNFTVEENDWDYGGTYTISVTLYEGTTDTMRVSMIAGTFRSFMPHQESELARYLQPRLAHTATTWALGRYFLTSLAMETPALSQRRQMHMFHLLAGISYSSSMVLRHPTLTGSGSEAT